MVGPPGCGKTSTVLAVASDREVLELNASSYRDRGSVHEIMGSFCSQMSLFGKKKLVLIDDIDAFSGRHDQGGIAEISRILETCRVPVVATATVLDDEKMASVLKRAEVLPLSSPNWAMITKILARICDAEAVAYDDAILRRIAVFSGGDLRAAINDLQSMVSKGLLLDLELMDREKSADIYQSLSLILKGNDARVIKSFMERLDDELIPDVSFPVVYSGENALSLWLEENIPLEYSASDTAGAFDVLSRADVMRGRIIKRNYWRFLSYISDLLGPGIALSKQKRGEKQVQYKVTFRSPKRNPRLWWLSSAAKKSVVGKVALMTHTSKKSAFKELSFMNPVLLSCSDYFGFDEKEIAFLRKS